jgi:hypothetical protein
MSSWWNSPICVIPKSELIANYNEMIATCKKLQDTNQSMLDNLVKIQTLQQTMLDRREKFLKNKNFTP